MAKDLKEYRLDNGELYVWLCLDNEELNQQVPNQFPKSSNRTWATYSTLTYLPNGLVFILIGEHDENGNRVEAVSDEEFQLWLDYFSGRNFWNYEDAKEYMKQFEETV